ncbi:hypothetical protein BaRGS_00001299, partial [Batillaria attramentaria]
GNKTKEKCSCSRLPVQVCGRLECGLCGGVLVVSAKTGDGWANGVRCSTDGCASCLPDAPSTLRPIICVSV